MYQLYMFIPTLHFARFLFAINIHHRQIVKIGNEAASAKAEVAKVYGILVYCFLIKVYCIEAYLIYLFFCLYTLYYFADKMRA